MLIDVEKLDHNYADGEVARTVRGFALTNAIQLLKGSRPAPIMLEILPIILLRISQIFTHYSFVLNLLFQNNSQKIHLY